MVLVLPLDERICWFSTLSLFPDSGCTSCKSSKIKKKWRFFKARCGTGWFWLFWRLLISAPSSGVKVIEKPGSLDFWGLQSHNLRLVQLCFQAGTPLAFIYFINCCNGTQHSQGYHVTRNWAEPFWRSGLKRVLKSYQFNLWKPSLHVARSDMLISSNSIYVCASYPCLISHRVYNTFISFYFLET